MSLRFPVLLLVGLLGATVVVLLISTALSPSPATSYQTSPTRSGSLQFDLGTRSDSYGSSWQAKELLSKIQQNPTTAVFVITATDSTGARVEVTADLRANMLSRTHSDTGKTERWGGDVMKRLQSAAGGGTFNT